MQKRKPSISNIIFLIVLVLMFIPQTRKPIQVAFNKVAAQFSPSVNDEEEQLRITYSDWQLVDNQGGIHNFLDFEGRVLLINYWATWCPPCIAEMPELQALYNDYSDKVTFWFVVGNDEEATVDAFLAEKGYTFPAYYSRNEPPAALLPDGLPTTYLLSKNGRIVIDKTGAANWNSAKVRETIDQLLQE